MEAERVETLIVGGSAAGLAVARCLEQRGRPAVVVEREPHVGTMWRHAYERLHLHTPRSRSGLPFLPMPANYPRYPSRQQVVDYLELYARTLKQPPHFSEAVQSVRRDGAGWTVVTERATYNAANVVVATGNARVPFIPDIAGLDSFSGTTLHSSEYRSGRDFIGRRVLVVGFGNSAAEIAIDLHEQGARPTLAVRGAVNVLPIEIAGIPIANLGLIQRIFSARVADMVNVPLCRLLVGDIERVGLRQLPYGPAVQIREHHHMPVMDIGAMALIRAGDIAVRPGVERVTANGAVFVGGEEEDFDAIVFGTGFRTSVPEFLGDRPELVDEVGTPRTSGEATPATGLYFCGFRVVSSGALREIGVEAQRIAEMIDTTDG